MSTQHQLQPPLSWEDLRSLPEDGRRFELWDGELYELTPGPSYSHQSALLNLAVALKAWAKGHPGVRVAIAPLDVAFREQAPARVVQPDLLVVLPDGAAQVEERGVRGAPDLVVEVLSPGSIRHDLVRKADRYAQEGVRSCWVVRPNEGSVEVWPLAALGLWGQPLRFAEDMALEDPLLPGFSLPLTEVFEGA